MSVDAPSNPAFAWLPTTETKRVAPPEKVQVVCRVRPSEEYGEHCVAITPGVGGDIVGVSGLNREFTASKAFSEECTQEEVFDFLGKPSIEYVMQGFGACIFAYGQTGSGKTFTMTGSPSAPGLIPRMIRSLFEDLVSVFGDFTVTAEYLEVYMEKVRDLFNPARFRNPWDAPGPKLNIRFDGKRVQVENAKRLSFGSDASLRKSFKDDSEFAAALSSRLLNDVENAGNHRVVRGHALNAESSRSHAVLSLGVTARKAGREIASTLMLVDLAGSENIGKAQVEGVGREEAKSINKSLFSLTRCIEALANGQKVPFRESVLTKLLTPALDGRSCCTLIAALRGDHAPETRETLKFMELAVKIAVRPKQTSTDALGVVQEKAHDLRSEIEMLKQEIEFLKRNEKDSASLRNMVAEKEKLLHAKIELLGDLQRDIRETEELLANVQRQLDASKEEIEQEKAKRVRVEAENVLLLARLRDVEARNDAENQMQKLQGQKRFRDRRQAILGDLASSAEKHCLEEAIKACVRLVQLLHEDLAMRLDDNSHRASLALLDNLRILTDRLETCLQIWSEVQARLSDLSFVARELDAQRKRIELLCQDTSRLAPLDWITYQSILEDMKRMSQSAMGIIVGQASTRYRTSRLQPLLQKIISLFSEGARQWRAYCCMWEEHWKFRTDAIGYEDGKHVYSDDGHVPLNEFVSLVATELEKLFNLFSANVAEVLDRAEIANFISIADEAQISVLRFLKCMSGAAVGGLDSAVQDILDELEGARVHLTDERIALCDSILQALHYRWLKLNAAKHSLDTQSLKTLVEEALHKFQVQDLCERDLFERCLSKPTDSFLRDAVKFVRCGAALLKHDKVGDFDWNETWTHDHPELDVKLRFIDTTCNLISSSSASRGWEGAISSESSRMIITECHRNSDSLEGLLLMGQLCIVAEASEIEQPSKEYDLLARGVAIAYYVAAFSSWINSLRSKVEHLITDRHHDMQKRLANSQNSVDALNDTIRQLDIQREQHLEAQKIWDVEREMMQQTLHKAQAENQQLMAKLETARQDWDRKTHTESKALQDVREEVAFWRQRSDVAEERLVAMQTEMEEARSRTRIQLKDADVLLKELAFTELLLSMVREMQDSLATAEGGQEVQDLIVALESVMKVHQDALRQLAGQDPELKEKMNLMNVADFISSKRTGKRMRNAKSFSRSGLEDSNLNSASSFLNDSCVDESSAELCDRLHMMLLALAEKHAIVGAVRLEEERALITYMRASLKKAWERRQNLASRVLELGSAVQRSDGEGSGGASLDNTLNVAKLYTRLFFAKQVCDPGAFRALAQTLRASEHFPELVELERVQPEFCKIRAIVESAGSQSLTLSVQRVRKVNNCHLEADFYDGIADCLSVDEEKNEPLIINSVFHGSSSRLCELISHEGFRLPRETGSKLGPFGNAVYFAMSASASSCYSVSCPGRLRSLIVCDLMAGRVFCPDLLPDVESGNMSAMTLEQMRTLSRPNGSIGYDSVFIAGGKGKRDEFAVYDARLAIPRYVVDFAVSGLGSENENEESEEVCRLKADLAELREQGGDVQVSTLRTKLQLLSEVILDNGGDACLINIERNQAPAIWDRFVDRLQQAAQDGPGLTFGLEAVMTRLERIVNPRLASQFYACAAELFYPEEAFQLLLCAATGVDVHRIIESGLALTLPNDGRTEDQLYGRGVYFATSASRFLGNEPGSHRLFVCEVALGKPMLAQSARPGLNADALKRAGFDSLHAPGRNLEDGDEWVIYNVWQARPAYLLSYDVQPKALVSQLLQEVLSLEDRRRLLDEQMAAVLQELENTKRSSDTTRLQLDENLARQLLEEEKNLAKAKKENRLQQERLDNERAAQLQEIEKAQQQVRELRRRSDHLPTLDTPPRSFQTPVDVPPASGSASGQGSFSRNNSLPTLRGRR